MKNSNLRNIAKGVLELEILALKKLYTIIIFNYSYMILSFSIKYC